MWFVVRVKPGTEQRAVEMLKSTPKSDLLEEVFCPMAERLHTQHGQAVGTLEPMMDGCVFVVAPSKWELRACIKRAGGLEGLLEGPSGFQAMATGEEAFIDLLAGPANRTVGMSEAVVDGSRIVVTSGPLRGREGDIRTFSNRHKRAYLDTRIAGAPASAHVGLRVMRGSRAMNGGR